MEVIMKALHFRILALSSLAWVITFTTAHAASMWYVDVTQGNDSTGSGTAASPWKTIQGAIDKAAVVGGDTIMVAVGTYGNIDTKTKSLTISGGYDNNSGTWSRGTGVSLIQQSAANSRAVTVNNVGAFNLDHFTVRGVAGGWELIYLRQNSPSVRLSYITTTNTSHYPIHVNSGSSLVIEYSTIHGGLVGVLVNSACPTLIANSIIRGCSNSGRGAAGHNKGDSSSFVIVNSLIYSNTTSTEWGTAFYFRYGNNLIVNSTIVDNPGATQGISIHSCNVRVRNSIVSANGTGFGIGAGVATTASKGRSIITDSPGTSITWTDEGGVLTSDTGVFTDRANKDYTLSPSSTAKEAGGYLLTTTLFGGTVTYVDADNNSAYTAKKDVIVALGGATPTDQDYLDNYIYTTDLAGNPRLSGTKIAAGAYEYYSKTRGTLILLQ